MSVVTAWTALPEPRRAVNWRGKSGRHYTLLSDDLDTFQLDDSRLYVLGAGDVALWVGTAEDVIESCERRTAFKAALKICSSVLRYDEPLDEYERMATAWDVENGHMAAQLRLVGAD